MSNPNYVKPGQDIRASWANQLVESIVDLQGVTGITNRSGNRNSKFFDPFDFIYIQEIVVEGEESDDKSYYVKIVPAYYYDRDGNEIQVKFEGESLFDYPQVVIEPFTYNYYFNYDNGEIFKLSKDINISGLTKVWRFDVSKKTLSNGAVSDFRWENLISRHINLLDYPPLHPFCWTTDENAETIQVMFNKGVAYDVKHGAEYENVNYYDLDIKSSLQVDQAIYVAYTLDQNGQMATAPSGIVESNTKSGKTNKPAYNEVTGEAGDYYIKLLEYSEGKIKRFCSDSYIVVEKGIQNIDSTMTEAASGMGRVLKEYQRNLNKWKLRVIKEKQGESVEDEAQIKIQEEDEAIIVKGNDKNGELKFKRDTEEIKGAEWKDGLVITEGVSTIDLTHVKAGSGIKVDKDGATYTISTSGLSTYNISAIAPLSAVKSSIGEEISFTISQREYEVVGLGSISVSSEVVGSVKTFTISTTSTSSTSSTEVSAGYPLSMIDNVIGADGETIVIKNKLSTLVVDITAGNRIGGLTQSGAHWMFFYQGVLINEQLVSGAHSTEPSWPDSSQGYEDIEEGFWDTVTLREIDSTKVVFQ